MSDDNKTRPLDAIEDHSSDTNETDEFNPDLDPDDAETRRLSSGSFDAQRLAAVPGRNSTMPIPAVSGSKTTTNPVPEAVLQRIRQEKEGLVEDSNETIERPPVDVEKLAELNDTVEERKRFQTLDVPMEAIGDETIKDEQMAPTVRFEAEIDGDGRIFVPRKYMGLLRFGQKVTVTVQAHLDENQ